MTAKIFNVYDLPIANNICEQDLREVLSLSNVSITHVTMAVNSVSLLHEHHKMTEVYIITRGIGILTHGSSSYEISRTASLSIPPRTPHKLKNIGCYPLEHLVLAAPPFMPYDVNLIDDSDFTASAPLPLPSQKQSVQALDGTFLYELLSNDERINIGFSLAIGILPVCRKARSHYHKISEEVYYVVDGTGTVSLGNEQASIKKGSVIHIPPSTAHALENTGGVPLEILCLSSPAYKDDDFFLRCQE